MNELPLSCGKAVRGLAVDPLGERLTGQNLPFTAGNAVLRDRCPEDPIPDEVSEQNSELHEAVAVLSLDVFGCAEASLSEPVKARLAVAP